MKSLLEQHANSYDIIFTQETPFSFVRNIASYTSELGDAIEGPTIHAAWQEVHNFSKYNNTQVCAFVSRRLLMRFRISFDPDLTWDANVLPFTLVDQLTGQSATLICLYNPPKSGDSAVKCLIDIAPRIHDLAFIQGDFNLSALDWDPGATRTSPIAGDLLAMNTLLNLSLVNDDGAPTWHHKTKRSSVLDLLFIADNILRRSHCDFENDHINRGTSDHSVFRIRLGRRMHLLGRDYIGQETDEEAAFIHETAAALHHAASSTTMAIQDVFDRLYGRVHAAWMSNAKTPKAGSNPTRWWSVDCDLAKEVFEHTRSRADRKTYMDTIDKARKAYFDHKIANMSNTKKPWEGVRWTGPRKAPSYSAIKDPTGSLIKDPAALFQHMHNHFNSTAASGDIDWTFINSLPASDERVFPPVSIAEVAENLKLTSNLSAPGEDHLTWRHLKLILDPPGPQADLASLFNRILDESLWPTQLKVANSVIIPKPKKDRYDVPKAFRPIALLNTMGKLLTKILAKRLQFDGIANDLFHPGQFGGISKHATVDVGVILVDIISQNRDRGLHTTVLALDIAQFFPSINHDVIAILMTKLGYHHKIINFLRTFLADRTTSYSWDGLTSGGGFECSNGIPQGDPLSPVLSALYLALIVKHFFPWNVNNFVNSLFFVDDGTLICSSFSMEDNTTLLAECYEGLLKGLAAIGLTVEQSKLELKHFIAYDPLLPNRTFASANQPPLRYTWKGTGHVVKPTDTWRYLGFFFDAYLKFTAHVKTYTNKGFSAIRACNMLGNSIGGLGPKQRVLCYNACVSPVLTYGLPLWYARDGMGCQQNLRHMARVQNFALRWITGAFKGTPIGAMELLAGIPPLQLRCNLLLSGYAARIMTLPENHLLRQAWHLEPLPDRLQHFRPKKRPRHLPSDNPLTRLRGFGEVQEQFDEFHAANRPGQRVIDLFTHRISYSHLDAPKKGSDGFQDWMKAFTGWIAEKEKMGHWMVYTDGGFWREKCRGTHAMVATRAGQEISSDVDWVLAASSFDTEIAALENAIAWITNHADIIDKDEVYILTDNKGVIQSFLQLQPRSSQMSALRISIMLTELFTTHPRIKLHFAHCPSHTGIRFNERADELASTFAEPGGIPTGLLRQHFIEDNIKEAGALWKLRSRLSTYKGRQWLAVRRKKKAFVPKIQDKNAKNFFLDLADNDMTAMAQITRAITNHAPTGEYYSTRAERFPDKETLCTNCSLAVIQTRRHIFTECTKYTNRFPSIRFWTNKKNNGESLKSFLRENPTAFSFSDVPPDIH